jgi:hypothetical protein
MVIEVQKDFSKILEFLREYVNTRLSNYILHSRHNECILDIHKFNPISLLDEIKSKSAE